MVERIVKVMKLIEEDIPRVKEGNKVSTRTAILNIELNLGKYYAYMELLETDQLVKMHDKYNGLANAALEAVESIYKL